MHLITTNHTGQNVSLYNLTVVVLFHFYVTSVVKAQNIALTLDAYVN